MKTKYGHLSVLFIWIIIYSGLLMPVDGTIVLVRFLKPGLWWLVTAGLFIVSLFTVVTLYNQTPKTKRARLNFSSLLKFAFILIPAPFILAFSDADYGTDALKTRLSLRSSYYQGQSLIQPNITGGDTTPDSSQGSVTLLELSMSPEKFVNNTVQFTGMVYSGERIPKEYLYIFRYVMVCCAADAMPVGVFVKKPEGIHIEDDSWVVVEGVVTTDSLDGLFVIKVNSPLIEKSQRPSTPWLFPGFN